VFGGGKKKDVNFCREGGGFDISVTSRREEREQYHLGYSAASYSMEREEASRRKRDGFGGGSFINSDEGCELPEGHPLETGCRHLDEEKREGKLPSGGEGVFGWLS